MSIFDDLEEEFSQSSSGGSAARNYKCPTCEGEFNVWRKERGRELCPFCGERQGAYGEIDDEEMEEFEEYFDKEIFNAIFGVYPEEIDDDQTSLSDLLQGD